jgi:hypothetical protein
MLGLCKLQDVLSIYYSTHEDKVYSNLPLQAVHWRFDETGDETSSTKSSTKYYSSHAKQCSFNTYEQ